MTVANGQMSLRATDYYLTIERSIVADVADDGVTIVSGHRLRDLVQKLPGHTVNLTSDDGGLTVEAGRSKYLLLAYPEVEYPATPPPPPRVGVVPAHALELGAKEAAHSAGVDPTQKAVYGAVLETDGENLWIFTTDAYRAAMVPLPWTGADMKVRVVFGDILAAVKNMGGDVTIGVDENRISFSCDNATVTAGLIDGDPIRWQAFQALTPAYTHTVTRQDLLAALDRAALVLEREKPVTVDIADQVMALSSADDKGSGTEQVEVVGDEAIRLGINPTYLGALLKSISYDAVELCSSSPTKAVLVHGISPDGDPAPATHVIMPVRLNVKETS
jgi:DNA polymerase-3 subunit beta